MGLKRLVRRGRASLGLGVALALVALTSTSCASTEELGIDWRGLAVQVINFLILLSILYFFAYKLIRRMLDQRAQRIKDSMDKAHQIEEEASRAEQNVARMIEEARREGQTIVSQASQIGERLKEEARQEARQEAEAIAARERARAQREREEAIDDLRREFVDVAILAAEKVINQSLDREAHRRLIEEVLEESSDLRESR